MKAKQYSRQSGFTIIELMVGIVIGLLVVLAATGSASFYEANRRNTIGSNGAQENATAAASFIQRHARMAGMWSAATFACPTGSVNKYNGTAYESIPIDPTGAGVAKFIEIPVRIATGTGTGNTDSVELSFAYSNALGGMGDAVLSGAKNGADFPVTPVPSTDNVSAHFAVGDIVLLSPPSGLDTKDCTMGVITTVQDAAKRLQMRPYANTNGQPSDTVTDFPQGSKITNLGQTVTHTMRINNNNFEIDDHMAGGTPVVIAENVVKMLARFGSDTAGTGLTAKDWPPTTLNTNSYMLQVILVARSAQREKPSSGNAADACDATASATLPKDWAGNTISIQSATDTSRADGTWQCYKYRAVQLQVPLKNLILQKTN